MSAIFLMIILISGYFFIDSHLKFKYNFSKSKGWETYFQVALFGFGFFLLSAIILAIISIIIISACIAYTYYQYKEVEIVFYLASKLLHLQILGLSFPLLLILAGTMIISIIFSIITDSSLKKPEIRKQMFKSIADCNSIENILYESIESKSSLLVSISMKSRKVYVGMVQEARIDNMDKDNIVIIPILSGYRDKDTLSFIEDVNYAKHFSDEKITFDSKPLSLNQYRHVIPTEQIESISLFNSENYNKFKKNK
jgi:hypothetical protein